MKRTKRLLVVLMLNIVWGSCWVSSANAGVITLGTWTAMNPGAYWNNSSWDGPGLNVGEIITSWGWTVEYLSLGGAPAAFAFDQPESFIESRAITAWLDNRGIWQLADGSITFVTHGYTYNTLTTPQQFSLFRWTVPTVVTVYFLGVEDIPSTMWSDRDYNDYIGYAIEYPPPPPPPIIPTPEPGTLALLLCGGLVAGRKVCDRDSSAAVSSGKLVAGS